MRSEKTLAEQTYHHLRERILSGAYPAGTKLPSIREISESLVVSRNTVERAYDQLLVEGYVYCKPRSGYFVESFDVDAVAALPTPASAPTLSAQITSADSPAHPARHSAFETPAARYDFCYHNPDPAAFPYNTWRKLMNDELLAAAVQEHNRYGSEFGHEGLREELAHFAFDMRGVRCEPEQVIIHAGLGDGLDRLLKLFDRETDVFACEEPCLHVAFQVARQNGFTVAPLDISSPEAFLTALRASGAKLVYVTPSHQFPTGSTMTLATRLALLEWAKQADAYIIEDDYDSEFRYHTKATPSLHSLDREGRVIYCGSLSKVLSPALRLSYWVYPPALLSRFERAFSVLPSTVPWLNQQVLYRFFREEHMHRHLRKYLTLNKRKREALLAACREEFGEDLRLEGTDAGLHLWAHLAGCEDASALIAVAADAGVAVYTVDAFYSEAARQDSGAFLLGHSRIAEADIAPGIRALARAWADFRPGR